jgi:hypothetical protein
MDVEMIADAVTRQSSFDIIHRKRWRDVLGVLEVQAGALDLSYSSPEKFFPAVSLRGALCEAVSR